MAVSFMVESMPSQISGQLSRPLTPGEEHGADDAHGAGFGRGDEAEEDRAEHDENQRQRRHHAA